jgi:hypothetical protein
MNTIERGQMSFCSVLRIALAVFISALVGHVFGAEIEPAEYEWLYQEASSKGHVRVLINLPEQVSLKRAKEDPVSIRQSTATQAAILRSELGTRAFDGGYWNNALGQVGLYVNTDGLKALSASTNARSFMADVTHRMRDTVYGVDGSLKAIEATLNATGFADVEIFLNIDEADYDLASDGRTVFRSVVGATAAISDRLQRLGTNSWARGMTGIDISPTARYSPSFKARIDKNAFFALRECPDVRAMRPIGYVDHRPARWDRRALDRAATTGQADVLIAFRGGLTYSPLTGYMSDRAVTVQTAAHDRALNDVLANAAIDLSSVLQRYSDTGSAYVKLSQAALVRLYAGADARILSVDLNSPSADPLLANSTVLVNAGPTWTAGYIGTGQYVTVLDTGIRKSHIMMQMSGSTKVLYEYCYGTNSSPFASICPSQNGSGDSPANTSGAGEPYANATFCAANSGDNLGICAHGTHVAGIAAGIPSSTTSPNANLPGLAQGAAVVSSQVFSYDTTNNVAKVFDADLLQSLTDGYNNTVSGTNNPFTLNISAGSSLPYPDDCDYVNTSIATKISQLTSRGVPIVIATGNAGEPNGMSWPACNPTAIKVGSVSNDSTGTTRSSFSNLGQPANFTGPIFLAPGGQTGSTTNYVRSSSSTSNTATLGIAGTSQAAPHLSGVYAMIKGAVSGVTVADASAWIAGTASFAVTYNLPSPAGTQTYRRLKLPNSY